ncbi:Integrator complex subunit [Schistosoma japonicum]|nr:Integrator complex subunit [Schistosoma japonicum]
MTIVEDKYRQNETGIKLLYNRLSRIIQSVECQVFRLATEMSLNIGRFELNSFVFNELSAIKYTEFSNQPARPEVGRGVCELENRDLFPAPLDRQKFPPDELPPLFWPYPKERKFCLPVNPKMKKDGDVERNWLFYLAQPDKLLLDIESLTVSHQLELLKQSLSQAEISERKTSLTNCENNLMDNFVGENEMNHDDIFIESSKLFKKSKVLDIISLQIAANLKFNLNLFRVISEMPIKLLARLYRVLVMNTAKCSSVLQPLFEQATNKENIFIINPYGYYTWSQLNPMTIYGIMSYHIWCLHTSSVSDDQSHNNLSDFVLKYSTPLSKNYFSSSLNFILGRYAFQQQQFAESQKLFQMALDEMQNQKFDYLDEVGATPKLVQAYLTACLSYTSAACISDEFSLSKSDNQFLETFCQLLEKNTSDSHKDSINVFWVQPWDSTSVNMETKDCKGLFNTIEDHLYQVLLKDQPTINDLSNSYIPISLGIRNKLESLCFKLLCHCNGLLNSAADTTQSTHFTKHPSKHARQLSNDRISSFNAVCQLFTKVRICNVVDRLLCESMELPFLLSTELLMNVSKIGNETPTKKEHRSSSSSPPYIDVVIGREFLFDCLTAMMEKLSTLENRDCSSQYVIICHYVTFLVQEGISLLGSLLTKPLNRNSELNLIQRNYHGLIKSLVSHKLMDFLPASCRKYIQSIFDTVDAGNILETELDSDFPFTFIPDSLAGLPNSDISLQSDIFNSLGLGFWVNYEAYPAKDQNTGSFRPHASRSGSPFGVVGDVDMRNLAHQYNSPSSSFPNISPLQSNVVTSGYAPFVNQSLQTFSRENPLACDIQVIRHLLLTRNPTDVNLSVDYLLRSGMTPNGILELIGSWVPTLHYLASLEIVELHPANENIKNNPIDFFLSSSGNIMWAITVLIQLVKASSIIRHEASPFTGARAFLLAALNNLSSVNLILPQSSSSLPPQQSASNITTSGHLAGKQSRPGDAFRWICAAIRHELLLADLLEYDFLYPLSAPPKSISLPPGSISFRVACAGSLDLIRILLRFHEVLESSSRETSTSMSTSSKTNSEKQDCSQLKSYLSASVKFGNGDRLKNVITEFYRLIIHGCLTSGYNNSIDQINNLTGMLATIDEISQSISAVGLKFPLDNIKRKLPEHYFIGLQLLDYLIVGFAQIIHQVCCGKFSLQILEQIVNYFSTNNSGNNNNTEDFQNDESVCEDMTTATSTATTTNSSTDSQSSTKVRTSRWDKPKDNLFDNKKNHKRYHSDKTQTGHKSVTTSFLDKQLWTLDLDVNNLVTGELLCDYLNYLLNWGLTVQPDRIDWLILRGEIEFFEKHYRQALSTYLEYGSIVTDSFSKNVLSTYFTKELVFRMMCCLQYLGLFYESVVLSQLGPSDECLVDNIIQLINSLGENSNGWPIVQTDTFNTAVVNTQSQRSTSFNNTSLDCLRGACGGSLLHATLDCPDNLIPYLWNIRLLSSLDSSASNRGAFLQSAKFKARINNPELNANNSDEILFENRCTLNLKYLRHLSTLYLI